MLKTFNKTRSCKSTEFHSTFLIRKNEKEQIASSIAEDPTPANVWKIVNSVINPNHKTETEITIEGSKNDAAANKLNSHFIKKIIKLQEKIDPSLKEDPFRRLEQKIERIGKKGAKFGFQKVSEKQVRKIIANLRKNSSAGPDGIDPHIIKIAADVIIGPLTYLINKSLQTGHFPQPWKLARVLPLFKKGAKDDPSNYRPISCLSVLGKILETCAKVQIAGYFDKHGLLCSGQHGFRSKRSTTSALISMCSSWTRALYKTYRVLYLGQMP